MDSGRFLLYRDKILLPFIRQHIDESYSVENEVAASLTAITWSDGDWAQLAATCDRSRMEREVGKRVLACKHAGGASLVQQFAYLMSCFRRINHLNKSTSKEVISGATTWKII